jgi:hypothetical protein
MTIVQRYLRSNIEAESSSSAIHTVVKGVWLSLRYRDLYQELKSGVDSTLQLLEGLRDLGRELLTLDPPSDIHRMASELERVCDGFLSGEPSTATPGSVLSTDRLLRYEGRVELEHLIDLAGELDALRSMADAPSSSDGSCPSSWTPEHSSWRSRDSTIPSFDRRSQTRWT